MKKLKRLLTIGLASLVSMVSAIQTVSAYYDINDPEFFTHEYYYDEVTQTYHTRGELEKLGSVFQAVIALKKDDITLEHSYSDYGSLIKESALYDYLNSIYVDPEKLSIYSYSGEEVVSEDVILVTFNVSPYRANTTYNEVISKLKEMGFYEGRPNDIITNALVIEQYCKFSKVEEVKGDLSMDGKVNIVDAVKLAKYNADPTAFPLLTYSQLAADINGDGELTNSDLVALIQMI